MLTIIITNLKIKRYQDFGSSNIVSLCALFYQYVRPVVLSKAISHEGIRNAKLPFVKAIFGASTKFHSNGIERRKDDLALFSNYMSVLQSGNRKRNGSRGSYLFPHFVFDGLKNDFRLIHSFNVFFFPSF